MLEDKNNPSTGSLFKSKFKTNDGSEEDNAREDYYGTFRDLKGKVWKLKAYIKTSEYGKWLKFYVKDPDQQQQDSTPQQQAPSFIPKEHIKQEQDPEEDIPF
jgi:hypothetical protein